MTIRAAENLQKMKNYVFKIFYQFSFHEKKHEYSLRILGEVYYALYY